eukprot:5305069-Prymnesium_polylepis.1
MLLQECPGDERHAHRARCDEWDDVHRTTCAPYVAAAAAAAAATALPCRPAGYPLLGPGHAIDGHQRLRRRAVLPAVRG